MTSSTPGDDARRGADPAAGHVQPAGDTPPDPAGQAAEPGGEAADTGAAEPTGSTGGRPGEAVPGEVAGQPPSGEPGPAGEWPAAGVPGGPEPAGTRPGGAQAGDARTAGYEAGSGAGFGGGAGVPPGYGYRQQAAEVPPITALARRYRLIRPTGGRKIAGVCAGLGRATNTDPTFWRVILAVLVVFGGVGLLGYAVCWVSMPGEEDEVAPIEAIFGRGRSGTPVPVTVLLSLAALGLLVVVINSGLKVSLLVTVLVGAVAVLLTRRSQQEGPPPTDGAPPPGEGVAAAPATARPAAGPPAAAYQSQGAYQEPFAPHGPYHRPTWEGPGRPATAAPVGSREIPVTDWGQTDYVPLAAPRPRQRSVLGQLTLLACCLGIAVLVLLDTVGVSVPADAYVGATLAIVGTALVVGAWRGRARWLIALGCVLAVALPVTYAGARWDGGFGGPRPAGDRYWQPRTVAAVAPSYTTSVGDATLDLSTVDFGGARRTVTVTDNVGDVDIVLPATVDTTVRLTGGVGGATVFGREYESEGPRSPISVTDLGSDGKGGGTLTLVVRANVGDVTIER